jgi:hypothetical protein
MMGKGRKGMERERLLKNGATFDHRFTEKAGNGVSQRITATEASSIDFVLVYSETKTINEG